MRSEADHRDRCAMQKYFLCVALVGAVSLGACGPAAPPSGAAAPQPAEAQATKESALYDQMRGSSSWEVALSLGNEILSKYPGTAAAAHVQESIGDVRAKVEAQ